MRTRNQSKQQKHITGNQGVLKPSENRSYLESDGGALATVSQEAVDTLLKRANSRGSSQSKRRDNSLHKCDSGTKLASRSEGTDKHRSSIKVTQNKNEAEGCSRDAIRKTPSENMVEGGSLPETSTGGKEEPDEMEWEDGSVPILPSTNNYQNDAIRSVTIEFDGSPDSAKRKPIRRASAEDKELAELVHKVHLLCLVGRGRLIDRACNDPLIQASLLSLLPAHLLKISDVTKLTANALVPLVNWFHNNFRIRSPSSTERTLHSALAFALESQEGTSEEVAALSVALFRALNLTTRFVSILDAVSLKPDAEKCESISHDTTRAGSGIFNSSTLMVTRPNQVFVSPGKQSSSIDMDVSETSSRDARRTRDSKSTGNTFHSKDFPVADQLNDPDSLACEARNDNSDACPVKKSEGSKRKGDFEFELQLEMALSSTAVGIPKSNMSSDSNDMCSNSVNLSSPFRQTKRIKCEETSSSSQGISTAVGSRKVGAPLYWAEVYCSGENLTGKWVHVDAVNAIVDGEQKVESAAAACKTSLRYAVAFAGLGAKDVTRRYCMQWYKIASHRISSIWWDTVLAPLKELESGATGGPVPLERDHSNGHEKVEASSKEMDADSSMGNSFVATRTSLEDMELETRSLTEPLPTNQQAYKNHHLYAIERWLTKYEILYPKGPVLGFCSGHPVYPRTCVQILHTKERWLREGLQVKVNELPVKELKRSLKSSKAQVLEADDLGEEGCQGTITLYGKWQTEPLCLPRAVNGIVPKNERGQVDVWSEKSLPPGTVHLRLPRVFPVAKRLGIDYAPAMVGFEFRNGRSVPVYEGIVVCTEFKDAILEAYAEEEERREADEKKRIERQAISRWYQLLSSILTRQRLNNCYGDGEPSQKFDGNPREEDKIGSENGVNVDGPQSTICQICEIRKSKLDVSARFSAEDHEHIYLTEDQSFDEESSTRTKRCRCGFVIQVEEL